MRQSVRVLLVFLTIITFCLINLETVNSVIAQTLSKKDDYSVYSTVLQEAFLGGDSFIETGIIQPGTKELVIKNQTNYFNPFEKQLNLLELMTPLTKDTLEDFHFRKKESVKLKDKFNIKIRIILAGKELDEIFSKSQWQNPSEDPWEIFKKKFSPANGYVKLSRIGFNKEKTQALVFASFNCGWLCGQGWYLLLIKQNDKWKIEAKERAWIS